MAIARLDNALGRQSLLWNFHAIQINVARVLMGTKIVVNLDIAILDLIA